MLGIHFVISYFFTHPLILLRYWTHKRYFCGFLAEIRELLCAKIKVLRISPHKQNPRRRRKALASLSLNPQVPWSFIFRLYRLSNLYIFLCYRRFVKRVYVPLPDKEV